MDTFEEIAEERRALADQLAGLTPDQQAAQSLCRAWRVHDVVAHLVMPLEVSMPRMVVAMLAGRGSFDRANEQLTGRLARRPYAELVDALRRKADSRFTPPGSGPEAPLVDVLVHGLDICWPLQLPRRVSGERVVKALDFLMTAAKKVSPRRGLAGLRLQASDLDWGHGVGPVVEGPADALLLLCTGRSAALDAVSGDGAPLLRDRLQRGRQQRGRQQR